ncbi:hypothetical protein JW948_02510 [bacterium]|nr:hypothetical protein [bacterium]
MNPVHTFPGMLRCRLFVAPGRKPKFVFRRKMLDTIPGSDDGQKTAISPLNADRSPFFLPATSVDGMRIMKCQA